MNNLPIDPILSCEEALSFESTFFAGDQEKSGK